MEAAIDLVEPGVGGEFTVLQHRQVGIAHLLQLRQVRAETCQQQAGRLQHAAEIVGAGQRELVLDRRQERPAVPAVAHDDALVGHPRQHAQQHAAIDAEACGERGLGDAFGQFPFQPCAHQAAVQSVVTRRRHGDRLAVQRVPRAEQEEPLVAPRRDDLAPGQHLQRGVDQRARDAKALRKAARYQMMASWQVAGAHQIQDMAGQHEPALRSRAYPHDSSPVGNPARSGWKIAFPLVVNARSARLDVGVATVTSPQSDPSRVVADLARLVAFDTQNPPGREHEAALFVRARLGEAGFSCALDPFGSGRSNIEARLENGDGPVLAFCTHLDVVPVGEGWSRDPFVLHEDEGRLYGRGACDAKGSLAAMLEALRLLAASRSAWRGTLLGVFVADEEVGSAGARRYAASRPRIDHVVIGEPTGNGIVIAHKGSLRPLVRVHGTATHSGTPDLGRNAIIDAGVLCAMIRALHTDTLRLRTHPLTGNASLTVTRIAGGIADNIVPDRCELLLDRRMIPGEDEQGALAEIRALLERAAAESGIRAEIAELRPTTGGAAETAPDRPVVRVAVAAARTHGVQNLDLQGFQGACDLVHFHTLGAQGVVMGPGALAVAHKADEFVPRDELVSASLIYRDLAQALLK